MISTAITPLLWDLRSEPVTLGGALVLRMEAELLHLDSAADAIPVHLLGADAHNYSIARIFDEVFGTSARRFELVSVREPTGEAWPWATERQRPGFSHFSFCRLLDLYAESRRPPRLSWSRSARAAASSIREQIPGRLICVHLRRVAPFSTAESNADPIAWCSFLDAHAATQRASFVLLGDDPVPSGISLGPRIVHANTLGLPLSIQLALIAQADGFIGMASGLCTAANLSDTPHVIFKHPIHHAAAMRAELGNATRFPFATPQQQLWRQSANRAALDAALDLIIP